VSSWGSVGGRLAKPHPPATQLLHLLTTEGSALRGNPAMARIGGMEKKRLQHPAVGLTPAKPGFRKRRRLPLAGERQARRRKSSTTWGPSRSGRSARAAALPLNIGASLIVVLLLSLGLWAAIWGAVASLVSTVLG
jgi:hypothetical protein